MDTQVNVHEAKTQPSRLLAQVERGERVIIARAGKPIATLEPISHERPQRKPGRDKGKVVIHDDFDDPLPEFDPDYMHPDDPFRTGIG